MSVVAVYNSKGGAGKTTTAVNLAWTAALNGPTLLWDLDPQGASSFFLQDARGLDQSAKKLLQAWLRPLEESFPLIILDCPPGLTLLSDNLFRAADALVIPVVPSALGFRTLEQVRTFLASWDHQPPAVLPFLSMLDRRRKDHRTWAESVPEGFLKTPIPLLTEIEKTVQLDSQRPWKRSARVHDLYQNLWDEIRRGLEAI